MATIGETAPFDAASHPYRWAMLAGLVLIYFSFGMTVAAMAPLVRPISHELGISNSAMGSILGAWPLVYIAFAIPCGALLDRIGPRRALALAVLVIAASGMMRGLAYSYLAMFFAVALFGIGGPLVSVGAPKLISLWFAGKERGLAMGIYVMGPSLGTIAALSLTNSVLMPMVDGYWRMVLWIYAAFVLLAGLVWLLISGHPASRQLEAQIAAEPQRPQMGIFLELIRLPTVQALLVMATCIFFFNHSLNNWLPEILRVGGMTASEAGFWSSIPTVVGIIAALIIPRLATPSRRVIILLGLIVGAAFGPLLIIGTEDVSLAFGLILQGLARGALSSTVVLTLMEVKEVGSARMGAAGGMYFSAGEIGGVLGPLTMGTMADLTGGFDAGLYLLTGVCAILLLCLARLRIALR